MSLVDVLIVLGGVLLIALLLLAVFVVALVLIDMVKQRRWRREFDRERARRRMDGPHD